MRIILQIFLATTFFTCASNAQVSVDYTTQPFEQKFVDSGRTTVPLSALKWLDVLAIGARLGLPNQEIADALEVSGDETFGSRDFKKQLLAKIEEVGSDIPKDITELRFVTFYSTPLPDYNFENGFFDFCFPSSIFPRDEIQNVLSDDGQSLIEISLPLNIEADGIFEPPYIAAECGIGTQGRYTPIAYDVPSNDRLVEALGFNKGWFAGAQSLQLKNGFRISVAEDSAQALDAAMRSRAEMRSRDGQAGPELPHIPVVFFCSFSVQDRSGEKLFCNVDEVRIGFDEGMRGLIVATRPSLADGWNVRIAPDVPQENLVVGAAEPETMPGADVPTESSTQRLARIARAANLPIASLPNLQSLQAEDYSLLQSALDGIADETGLDTGVKSVLASAVTQAANMAFSPILEKFVFEKFGLQSQIIFKGIVANPVAYASDAGNSASVDLLKGIAIGIAGGMAADAIFSLKPLSDLPPKWKEPMRAMSKATVVETINLGTSAVDPSAAAAGIANRLYEFYQIYKASVALADTQNEAVVAAAIGLETAARLVTMSPSEKNNEIARSTITSTVTNLNQAFGDGYSVAMTELVNLTFVGLLSEFRGDTDRATQMVAHIREKGELGADDALPDVLARPINWIASFATWSGDPPSRVAALMISTTALSNLTQMSETKMSEAIAPPASGDWINTESASTTLRPGETRDGLEIAADGVVKYWAAPVFSRVVDSTTVELRLFSSPDRTHAVALQWDLDRGGVRAALLDIVGRRIIRNDLIPETAVNGLSSPESVRIAMLPVAWSPEGRYFAFPLSSAEWQADPMLVNGKTGASTVLLTDDLAQGSWVFPDLATVRWGSEDWIEMGLTVIRCIDADCTAPVETGKVEASYRVSTLFEATSEQPRLATKPDSEMGNDVWGPDIVPGVEVGYNPCGERSQDDRCLRELGLSEHAIAFSSTISGDYSGFAVAYSFQDLGPVDLAVAIYQGANTWFQPVLVNGSINLSMIQQTEYLQATFTDPESQNLLRQFPDAASFATGYYTPVSSHRTLADGTQRFTQIEMITEGCHACAPIGTAITFLDIGSTTGGKVLRRPIGIGFDPSLPGMDMQVTPQLLMETSAILQFYLNRLGYDAGSMDGRAGPQTRQALIEFQAEHCLPSTGQLDTATATALFGADGFSVPCKGAAVSAGTPGSASTDVGSSGSSPIPDGTYINMSAFGGAPGLCAESTIKDEEALRVTEGKLGFYEYACEIVGSRPSSKDGYVTLALRCDGEGEQWEVEQHFQRTSEATFELGGEYYQGCLGREWVAAGAVAAPEADLRTFCQSNPNDPGPGEDGTDDPGVLATGANTWRCMDGQVLVCDLGASGRACLQTSRPSDKVLRELGEFCRQNANSDYIAGYLIGGLADDWRCDGTKAVAASNTPVDKLGYFVDAWRPLDSGGNSVSGTIDATSLDWERIWVLKILLGANVSDLTADIYPGVEIKSENDGFAARREIRTISDRMKAKVEAARARLLEDGAEPARDLRIDYRVSFGDYNFRDKNFSFCVPDTIFFNDEQVNESFTLEFKSSIDISYGDLIGTFDISCDMQKGVGTDFSPSVGSQVSSSLNLKLHVEDEILAENIQNSLNLFTDGRIDISINCALSDKGANKVGCDVHRVVIGGGSSGSQTIAEYTKTDGDWYVVTR